MTTKTTTTMVTMRTTRTKATLLFDTTTNLEVGCIPGREGGDDFNGNNDNYDKNNGDDDDGHKDTTMTKMTMMMTTWLDAFLAEGGGLKFSFYYTPHSIAAKTMDLYPPRSPIVVHLSLPSYATQLFFGWLLFIK